MQTAARMKGRRVRGNQEWTESTHNVARLA